MMKLNIMEGCEKLDLVHLVDLFVDRSVYETHLKSWKLQEMDEVTKNAVNIGKCYSSFPSASVTEHASIITSPLLQTMISSLNLVESGEHRGLINQIVVSELLFVYICLKTGKSSHYFKNTLRWYGIEP